MTITSASLIALLAAFGWLHSGAAPTKTPGSSPTIDAPNVADGDVEVSVKPGAGVTISAGRTFSLNVLNTLQLRGRYVQSDRTPPIADAEVLRVRNRITGHLWSEANTYFLQNEWRGGPRLLDAWFRTRFWTPATHDSIALEAGQMLPRHGRQFETPIIVLEMTSRSLASDTFSGNRVLAARLLGNHLENSKLTWSVALAHGDPARASSALEAPNGATNVEDEFDYIVDVSFDPMGRLELTEADLETRQELRGSIGASVAIGNHHTVAPPGGIDIETTSLNLNSAWKGYGVHLLGDVFVRRDRQSGGTDADSLGWTVQASYTRPPPEAGGVQWGLAARHSIVELDDAPILLTGTALSTVSGKIRELAGVASAYFHAHHLKAQLAYRHLNVAAAAGNAYDENAVELFFQIQF